MSLFSRLFSRQPQAPLLELDALLEAREVPTDLQGLEDLRPDFEHLAAPQRESFADALADLHVRRQPLPPAWVDAQYELSLEVIPAWRGEKEGFFYHPVAEGLCQRILVNGAPMPEAWPTLWLVRLDEVLERALEHLRDQSKAKPFEKLPTGIYRSRFGDGKDAARLLLPELWENLFPGQNHFLAVPAEDCLLVAPQVLLPKLVEAIQKQSGAPNRVSATILQWVNRNLLPANLQDPHPIAQPQRELRQMDFMAAVAAQDASLDPALGRSLPVASIRAQNGRTFTLATWQAGAPALLPETDLIAFHGPSGEPFGVYFRATLPRIPEVKGAVVEIWGPRRLRFEAFPSQEQLDKLERFASAEQWQAILNQSAEPGRPAAPKAPKPQAAATASPALSTQAATPLPPSLRNAGLGIQDGD